jgi:lactoylglutathione lyase
MFFLRFPVTDCKLELCSFPDSGKIEVPKDPLHLAFKVENLDNCIFKLKHSRSPITEGPIETSNGTCFIFTKNPDKYEIELMQYSKQGLRKLKFEKLEVIDCEPKPATLEGFIA